MQRTWFQCPKSLLGGLQLLNASSRGSGALFWPSGTQAFIWRKFKKKNKQTKGLNFHSCWGQFSVHEFLYRFLLSSVCVCCTSVWWVICPSLIESYNSFIVWSLISILTYTENAFPHLEIYFCSLSRILNRTQILNFNIGDLIHQ